MKISIKNSIMKNMLLFILLFFASMNFQAKFFYFVFMALFVTMLMHRLFRIDYSALVYLALGILMAFYNYDEGFLSMLRCLAPFCYYLVGLNLASCSPERNTTDSVTDRAQTQSYTMLAVVSLGSFTHYGINYVYNIGEYVGRNTNDIWTGQPMAATGQNALACLMMAFSVAVLFFPMKKWHRVAAAASLVVIFLYNLILATRTTVVVFCVLLLVAIFYPNGQHRTAQKKFKYLLVFLLVLGGASVLYHFNVSGIRDVIDESFLLSRFDGTFSSFMDDSDRMNAKLAYLKNMWEYPFGGLHLREQYSYAHDLLLDGYDEYGIVALLLLVIILITGIMQLYRILRYTRYSKELKLALLLIYVSILLEFIVEPVLAGMQWLFASYCLINGCMKSLNQVYMQAKQRG